ncbi:MAG: hypothetical protein RBQ71_06340 [Acholeplasmataceae bacterium]|jgi:hypothetical protein|nr:hypothetical protein [Acholeplasmataceae bacterium]
MELNKAIWLEEDKHLFIAYLENYRRKEKEEWTKKILNTKLDVLAMPTKTIHTIAQEISKGNFKSFLDLKIFTSYESIALYGMVLCKIKDFQTMKHYLTIYLDVMENWAHVDLLSLPITKENKEDFIKLSHDYLTDMRPFVRRLSLMILFQMRKDEDAYYVIMMAGWLLSECIILYKDQTLTFISSHPDLNKKIVNKGIQKCRESLRFTQEEKDFLLQYKKK